MAHIRRVKRPARVCVDQDHHLNARGQPSVASHTVFRGAALPAHSALELIHDLDGFMPAKVERGELGVAFPWGQREGLGQRSVLQVLHAEPSQQVLSAHKALGALLATLMREVPFICTALLGHQRA